MSLIWNNKISVSCFGEESGGIVGITISGLPAGEYINSEETERYLRRLSPKSLGNVRISMPRIMSGIENERTTGGALCAVMKIDTSAKKAEDTPKNYRFGHADYTGAVCNRGYCDTLEKSRTAEIFAPPICFAGAICGQILERRGIYTAAHALRIHNVKDNPFDAVRLDRDGVICVRSKDFPVINDKNGWKMLETISAAADADETLGGIVECASINVPSGVGSPVFNGLTNNIAQLLFGIPDISGVEFGAGFSSAEMAGSQYTDNSYTTEQGYSATHTNSHGGIINGITSGMPVVLRAAFHPPKKGTIPCCNIPRAVVYVESAVNTALLSAMLDYPNFC
ncbi:MAG: chorismate synthase [Ruminococcus sp.]|nr:chorismate synthase [Ruminococcus sp.]